MSKVCTEFTPTYIDFPFFKFSSSFGGEERPASGAIVVAVVVAVGVFFAKTFDKDDNGTTDTVSR